MIAYENSLFFDLLSERSIITAVFLMCLISTATIGAGPPIVASSKYHTSEAMFASCEKLKMAKQWAGCPAAYC